MGKVLSFLGVTGEEEEAYRALLRRDPGPGPAAEAVARLLVLGLAAGGADGEVRAVPPARAVDALVERRLRTVREELEAEAARRAVVETLFEETRPASPPAGAGTIVTLHGIDAVREAIDELTFFARAEDLTTEPTGVLTEESIAFSHPINMRLLRRGVRLRTLMGAGLLRDRATLAYMRELVAHGARVRVARQPVERMIVVDRSAALTPIDPAHTARGALLVREPGLVATLVALFERMWEAAEELPGEDAGLPSDVERSVLAMLREADKDETAARRLGMSVRTYRKHLAAVTRRLGAANRVEAALLAHEKGWLD
ncbi:helix-turn-helix transcriptional regulator [Streptomyces roseolus]|uniref:helix-turn-helix transcriptional regulator n=1 Tax=Streptomyces roseolus TaxID=67358 RepID=UPI0016777D61|nr:LuxR C-terminal-related transcriptional regulator [Streptomyces roseolus]GGR50516.1 LuxR family transcriptional regulator [Streptomyces roseolus]